MSDFRIKCLLDDVLEFWRMNGEALLTCIGDLRGFCVSVNSESIVIQAAKRYALYFDTLCIEDPLFGTASVMRQHGERPGQNLLGTMRAKFLSLLLLEPLIEAAIEDPIVVIYPGPHFLRSLFDPTFSENSDFESSYTRQVLAFFEDILGPLQGLEDLV